MRLVLIRILAKANHRMFLLNILINVRPVSRILTFARGAAAPIDPGIAPLLRRYLKLNVCYVSSFARSGSKKVFEQLVNVVPVRQFCHRLIVARVRTPDTLPIRVPAVKCRSLHLKSIASLSL